MFASSPFRPSLIAAAALTALVWPGFASALVPAPSAAPSAPASPAAVIALPSAAPASVRSPSGTAANPFTSPPAPSAPAAAPSFTEAGQAPVPAFHFGSIQQFIYSPKQVYEIRARVGSFVNIEVPEGERIEGFYLSDTTLWRFVVANDHRRVMVKPGQAGSTNSGTLVTNRRVYELSFLAVPPGQPWLQRVQWNSDQPQTQAWGVFESAFDSFSGPPSTRPADQPPAAASSGAPADSREGVMVDAERVNFGWSITGSAPFRPTIVFDDGRFTYIRLPAVQDMPALFAIDAGQMRVIDYAVRGDTMVVPRVSEAFVLRLGSQSVEIRQNASSSASR